MAEQGAVVPQENPPPALDLVKLQLYVFPMLLHIAPVETQLEWLNDPADPKWGPPMNRAQLERLICTHLHGVEQGDPRHTLAAARHVGAHTALHHHRGGFGPTPDDFAQSPALRRLAVEVIERGVLPPGRQHKDLKVTGFRLIQGWERMLLAQSSTGAVAPDALDAEPGMATLWDMDVQHRIHLLRLRVPVLPAPLHRLWQTVVTQVGSPKLEERSTADIQVVVTGLSDRPTLLQRDGADRWQQWLSQDPAMAPAIRDALMNLLACGWQLSEGETVRTVPRGWNEETSTEADLPVRIPFDATWAPVLALLRAQANADPRWAWSLDKVSPDQRRLTLRMVGTEDPALLGERLALLWDSGWQSEIEIFLLSPACPSDRPVMWRSLLLHRDARLRLLATRALGESSRSAEDPAPQGDTPAPVPAAAPDDQRLSPRR